MNILETKAGEGGKKVLASVLFLCKSMCGMALGGRIFFVALPILSAPFSPSSPALASPHCQSCWWEGCFLDTGRCIEGIPRYSDTLQNHKSAKRTQIFTGCQTLKQAPSTNNSFPSQWNCTGFVLAPGTAYCGLRFKLSLPN